jgi:hypothetical protein
MSPIITHEDEIELASMEKDLASQIKKLAKAQSALIDSQKKYADNLRKVNSTRDMTNRTFRDVLKQMQTLAREKRSNIKDEEVEIFQKIIHQNDDYIAVNNDYINAIKDLAIKKDYLVEKKYAFADALLGVAGRRHTVIKKALSVEKKKNDLIEGEKMNLLEAELNDLQREFDRARDIFLKTTDQFLQVKSEVDDLWLKLKNAVNKSS